VAVAVHPLQQSKLRSSSTETRFARAVTREIIVTRNAAASKKDTPTSDPHAKLICAPTKTALLDISAPGHARPGTMVSSATGAHALRGNILKAVVD
jgi:hypothetical protein